jgi:transcriptional regulator with XRE-family HTH domain
MDRDDHDATGPVDRSRREAFGLQIRRLRTTRGLTQEQLADASGVHRTFIGQVERGRVGMRIIYLWPLSKALDTPIADLFVDDKGQQIR